MRASTLSGVLIGLATLLSGCSVGLVAASVTTVGAAGVLGYTCDGYVNVTVRDSRTGLERCNERVIAENGDDQREITTCAWARLPPGKWKIRPPSTASYVEPVSLEIEPIEKCEKTAYTIELA